MAFDLSTARTDGAETLTDTGEVTTEGRPIFKNQFGDSVTERTITITDPRINQGQATNIPTVFQGQFLSDEDAIKAVVGAQGKDPITGRNLQGFASIGEAVKSAESRSAGILQPKGGFDLSSARPEDQRVTPSPRPSAGRSRGGVGARNADIQEGKNLLNLLNQGVLSTQGLTDKQRDNLEVERIKAIPEIADVGLQKFLGEDGLDTFITAAVGLTTFNEKEFGKILSSRHPQIGITTTKEGQTLAVNNETGTVVNLNKEGLSMIDIFQGLGVVSAFTPATRAAGAAPAAFTSLLGRQAPAAITRAGVGGAAGVATEAGIQSAQEAAGGTFDKGDIALAGAFGGGSELIGPLLASPINKLRSVQRGAEETLEQTGRREAFEAAKLNPTRAQVTRDPGDFQGQSSIEKTDPTGGIARQLEEQEQILQGKTRQLADLTGGEAVSSTSSPINEIIQRSIDADDKISQLYKAARSRSPGVEDIPTTKLSKLTKRLSGQDTLSGGVVSGVKGELEARGLIDNFGISTDKKINTVEAEELRNTINTFFKESGENAPRGNQLIREFKEALDEDVFKVKGEDLFKEARKSKADFEQGLNRAKIHKFDSSKTNLIRDLLNNKSTINPDKFVQDTIFRAKFRAEDINQLKLFLNQTESGRAAWKDVRAQTIAEIEEQIFRGPLGSDGKTRALSRVKVDNVIKKLGNKIDVVLEPQEKKFILNLKTIAGLREAPRLRGGGLGPSEAGAQKAADQVRGDMGLVREIFRRLSNFQKNKMLQKLPKQRGTTAPNVSLRGPTQAAQTGRQAQDNQQSGRNNPPNR